MHLQKNKMRVFIDADGCPVTESAINFAKQHNIGAMLYVILLMNFRLIMQVLLQFQKAKTVQITK